MLTRLYIDLADAQGQLTPQSVVESGQNSNSSKLLWLFLLPARMKKIQSTRIDVYETLCPQQMLVHKGGKIKNWGGECRNVTPTKLQFQNIFKEHWGGGGGQVGGGEGQSGCERRIEVFVKIQKPEDQWSCKLSPDILA